MDFIIKISITASFFIALFTICLLINTVSKQAKVMREQRRQIDLLIGSNDNSKQHLIEHDFNHLLKDDAFIIHRVHGDKHLVQANLIKREAVIAEPCPHYLSKKDEKKLNIGSSYDNQ